MTFMYQQKKEDFVHLVARAQNGDRASLESLCKALERDIRGYFQQKFMQPDVVDDLTQETYVRLMRNLPNLREPVKLRGFVVKVAIHVSQDYLRKKYRNKEESLEDRLATPSDNKSSLSELPAIEGTTERVLDQMVLQKALDALPEKTRQIVLMKADGYKYEEIADELSLSVSGVKMQIKRGFEKMQIHLAGVTFLLFAATISNGEW